MKFLFTVASVSWLVFSLLFRSPDRIYNCSSSKFDSFPADVQEECIYKLQEELIELIQQRMQEEAAKKYIEV